MTDFDTWFSQLAGRVDPPHDWQRSLAAGQEPRNRLIRIPTGMGKTLGVLAAWAWYRLHQQDDDWPRRLVWCLPMRVLVEQTEQVVREALGRLNLLWDGSADHTAKVGVHLLMGGVDPGGDWNLFPEECAVLIGTQDMLLSRALNRGYGSGRARWPSEFGLLSHDALWVMDEVQLMDVGLATSAQLQAFLDEDAAKGFRPRRTWWMSATLQPGWLKSVDTESRHVDWTREPTVIPAGQRGQGMGVIDKILSLKSIASDDVKTLAQTVFNEHQKLVDGEYGRITLVVCNTVDRACAAFAELRALAPAQQVELVHSRFRPWERVAWRERFLSREACVMGADRIIVATQVVEAGVDISAGCVVTDLAPWPSLVQRFGRCARYGGRGAVLVIDRGRDERNTAPYTVEELNAAWAALRHIGDLEGDVGIASLETFEDGLDDEGRKTLYPYEPRYLLLRREFDELFDTTPDLTGSDLDISRFIRSGDERDLHVFWLDIPKRQKEALKPEPPRRRRPQRDELCAVPFLRARDWLCGPETKTNRKPRLRVDTRAWVWDWLDGEWVVADRSMLNPGRIVCVAADCGGYRLDRGFDVESKAVVPPVPAAPAPPQTDAQNQADESEGNEDLSASGWKTIGYHCGEVVGLVNDIATAIGLPVELRRIVILAGRWHDLGKAHPAFQGAIRGDDRHKRQDLAKAPGRAWLKPPGNYRTADEHDRRPGLRHELASALSLFAVLKHYQPRHPALLGPWLEALQLTGHTVPSDSVALAPPCVLEVLTCSADDFDLLAYLVASHHGKVRVALHAAPKDQDYRDRGDGRGLPVRGVREGDVLPSVALDTSAPPLPSLTLTLQPASLGLSEDTGRSWRERTLHLVDRLGPGALAWLEALIVAADRRASKLKTFDPALAGHESPR